MKYCKEITERICKSLIELKGRVKACEEAGISYETFTVWMEKPEFSETIKKAEEESRTKGKEIAIMSIFRAMPTQWQAGAWWLERQFKKDFAKEETHNQIIDAKPATRSLEELRAEFERLQSVFGEEESVLPLQRDTGIRSTGKLAT